MPWRIDRFWVLCLLMVITTLASGCGHAQISDNGPSIVNRDRKILIVYLSRTSNTKVVAEFIREEIGGELVALELAKPYPADYRTTVEQVVRENETGFLPPLKTRIDRIGRYDIVFVGFPTWGMQLPPPIKSFLKQYDLNGKTVVPFNTHAGYGVGSGYATMKNLCAGCNVLDGFTTRGGIERDAVSLAIKDARAEEVKLEVRNWLRKIKALQ